MSNWCTDNHNKRTYQRSKPESVLKNKKRKQNKKENKMKNSKEPSYEEDIKYFVVSIFIIVTTYQRA